MKLRKFNRPLPDGCLIFKGKSSFLCLSSVYERFSLCIETYDGEVCQGLHNGDLIIISAPESLETEPALLLLLLIKKHHFPLLVLPKGHPGSRRIRYVVSAGRYIELHHTIERGTHPEQNVICSSEEFSGISLLGEGENIEARGLQPDIITEYISLPSSFEGTPRLMPV